MDDRKFEPTPFICVDLLYANDDSFVTGALELKRFHGAVYAAKRNRQADGSDADIIDCFVTGERTKDWFRDAYIQLYEKRYGVNMSARSMRCAVGDYDLFSVPDIAAQIALFDIHRYDLIPGIWVIDMSDVTRCGRLTSPKRHAHFTHFTGVVP